MTEVLRRTAALPRTKALRHTTALWLAAAVAAALATGCTKDSKEPSAAKSSSAEVSAAPGARGSATATPGTALPSPTGEKVDYTDPETVAAAFVNAYVRQSWEDPTPRQYLVRIKPFSTAGYVKKLRDISSDRCDVTCEHARKNHVVVSADSIDTVIPDEAPRTASEVWVQVTYTERTSWRSGGDSASADMVLQLARTGGKWLVDGRQQGT